MRLPGLWLLLVVLSPSLQAQKTLAEYEASYRNALALVKAKDFEKARLVLGPLTQARYTHARAPYANYFYALSLLKTARPTEAKNTLRQLLERFPTWEKVDEAHYLMANACFEDEDYPAAIEALRTIDDPTLRPDANALEDYYLRRNLSLPVLKGLYVTFPDDRLVALSLIDLIQRTSTEKADLELSDRLTNRYGVRPTPSGAPTATSTTANTPTTTSPPAAKSTGPKGVYNVGVLFPFQVAELDERNRPVRNTQFALDLYNGIRLAVKRLQTDGTLINLFAYDIENDSGQMQNLVKNRPFQQTDLLIGPLYVEPYKVAAAWSAENGVPLVNPISTNRRLIEGAPNQFLVQPSPEQQAVGAAQFAQTRFGTAPAAVFYGPDRVDSLMAAAYVAQLKVQKTDVLVLKRNALGSAETVATSAGTLEGKRLGHIFVASSQKGSGTAFLSALSKNRLGSVPTLLLAEAFALDNVSASTFSGREVFLLDPTFADPEKPEVQTFL
ncbi:MAG: amino acid ABC transporter substrate-binding protein, partial [Sphingobacteriaceae bacterium]|nr:amino acid ABC transporter substrate-binding protein [Cytophagaceae bacterium]